MTARRMHLVAQACRPCADPTCDAAAKMAAMQPARRLYADPAGLFLHQAILNSCQRFAAKTALVVTSTNPPRHISYGEYGELVGRAARGLVAAGLQPGEVIGIFLWNCWEFPVAYHAATLAGAIPTLLNPSYREREVRYQLETADAVMLITDAAQMAGDRKSTRLNSSHVSISYAVFCLKKKKK